MPSGTVKMCESPSVSKLSISVFPIFTLSAAKFPFKVNLPESKLNSVISGAKILTLDLKRGKEETGETSIITLSLFLKSEAFQLISPVKGARVKSSESAP